MNLGAEIGAALPQMRVQAESNMVDTCTVTRASQKVWSETDMRFTTGATQVYSGRCRIQSRNVEPLSPEAGGARFPSVKFVCQLPVSAVDVAIGDTVTVVSSVWDPSLPGRRFTVTGLEHKTHLTARRLTCEEVL